MESLQITTTPTHLILKRRAPHLFSIKPARRPCSTHRNMLLTAAEQEAQGLASSKSEDQDDSDSVVATDGHPHIISCTASSQGSAPPAYPNLSNELATVRKKLEETEAKLETVRARWDEERVQRDEERTRWDEERARRDEERVRRDEERVRRDEEWVKERKRWDEQRKNLYKHINDLENTTK